MKSHSSFGMLAAMALGAAASAGNAVEVSFPKQESLNLAVPPPKWLPRRRMKRLNARVQGGNWQGMPYLSYAEHDRCTRATFGLKDRHTAYQAERERVITSR